MTAPTLNVDLDVEFAGQKVHYKQVPIHNTEVESSYRVSGTVPSKLTDFNIAAPSFLMVPIRNEIPVRFELVWHRSGDGQPPTAKQPGDTKP